MNQYFRVTVYHPTEDLSAIFDSNGMFEKLWQFSSYFVGRGFNIIEVSGEDKFLDGDISKAEPDLEKMYLRATMQGKPTVATYKHGDTLYHGIKVGDKTYVPDKGRLHE